MYIVHCILISPTSQLITKYNPVKYKIPLLSSPPSPQFLTESETGLSFSSPGVPLRQARQAEPTEMDRKPFLVPSAPKCYILRNADCWVLLLELHIQARREMEILLEDLDLWEQLHFI